MTESHEHPTCVPFQHYVDELAKRDRENVELRAREQERAINVAQERSRRDVAVLFGVLSLVIAIGALLLKRGA